MATAIDLIRCDQCSHDLAEHDQGVWEMVGASLVCSYILERHWRAVDDIEDRLCECVVPYWPYQGDRPWTRDGGLAARWHLAKAAALLPEGEAERVLTLAEAVRVATEARA